MVSILVMTRKLGSSFCIIDLKVINHSPLLVLDAVQAGNTWKVAFDLLGSVKLKLMDVQSQLLLVFSLHGDADIHVFARCMW
jgi:hypothetical protein